MQAPASKHPPVPRGPAVAGGGLLSIGPQIGARILQNWRKVVSRILEQFLGQVLPKMEEHPGILSENSDAGHDKQKPLGWTPTCKTRSLYSAKSKC